MNYHERMKQLRIEHGLSLVEVAKLLGRTPQMYERIENGLTEKANVKDLIILCDLYHVSAGFQENLHVVIY